MLVVVVLGLLVVVVYTVGCIVAATYAWLLPAFTNDPLTILLAALTWPWWMYLWLRSK